MILFKSLRGIPFIIILQSILLAFYADVKCINLGLAYGFFYSGDEVGFTPLLYAGVIMPLIICAIIGKNIILKRITRTYIVILLLLIAFYAVTLNFIGSPRIKPVMFFVMVVISMSLPNMVRINARIFIKYIMFFSSFAVFRINQVFRPVSDWYIGISMDTSYAFLLPICAAITYMYLYYKEENNREKLSTIILFVINMMFFAKILLFGSRGPILCVLLMILFLYFVKQPQGLGVKKNKHIIMFCVLGLIFLYLTYLPILSALSFIAELNGIKFHFVEKIINLSAENNLSNGRDIVINVTINGIIDNPIFGHGLDRFDANTGMLYPHNIVLQLLYDGGLVVFLLLIIPFIRLMSHLLKTCTKGEYAIFTVLCFSSIPGAFFSGDMWGIASIWLFYGFLLSKNFVVDEYKKNIRNKYENK